MKIKDGFILRPFENQYIALATEGAPSLANALIVMSGSGAFVWNELQQHRSEDELIHSIMEKYEVSRDTAAGDLAAFLQAVRAADILES